MLNTMTINPFINQIIFNINDLLSNKDIDQKICDYLYLVAIGLILKYGNDIEQDVYSIFKKIRIETKYNKIVKIAKEADKEDLFSDDKVKIYTFYKDNEYIICIKDDIKFEGIKFLELLVKEFNQILNSIIIGVAVGAQPIVGYNYGAEKFDRVKNALKTVLKLHQV